MNSARGQMGKADATRGAIQDDDTMLLFSRKPQMVSASTEADGRITAGPVRDDWEKLYQYWRSKHVDGRPPAQSDLDPVIEIPRLLPVLSLLAVFPDGFEYRLAGTTIVDYFGCELRGRRVGSLGSPTQVSQHWIALLREVSGDQKPRLVTSRFAPRLKTTMVTIVLPLVTPAGTTERILTGIFFDKYTQAGLHPESLHVQTISH
jgi:hypothetical protein